MRTQYLPADWWPLRLVTDVFCWRHISVNKIKLLDMLHCSSNTTMYNNVLFPFVHFIVDFTLCRSVSCCLSLAGIHIFSSLCSTSWLQLTQMETKQVGNEFVIYFLCQVFSACHVFDFFLSGLYSGLLVKLKSVSRQAILEP